MSVFDFFRPVRTRQARYGRVTYFARDVWHGRAFRLYGEWSEDEVALWRKLIKPGDKVLDVGAHVGAHTLALASLVGPTGRVEAFEPQDRVRELLDRNVAQNGLGRVVNVWSCALGERTDTMSYAAPDYVKTGNFGGVELFPYMRHRDSRPVLVNRFDDLAGDLPVSFIKADVEGMELNVLRGARQTIVRHRPALYVEADRPGKAAELWRWLDGFGYQAMWHVAPLFNPDNFDGRRRNVFGDVASVSLLALPPGRDFPVDPFLHPFGALRLTDRGIERHA